VRTGWPHLTGQIQPAYRKSISFGERYQVNFTKLLGAWSKVVPAELAQQERANKEAA
jgi:hypothetical protein